MTTALLLTAAGLVLLLIAGDALVKGAVNFALRLGIPALIVSLTIVAFGTSAPELLIAVEAIIDGAPGIAMGNVVGSNLFNSMAVIGIPAMLQSYPVADEVLRRDYPAVLLSTLALFLMSLFAVRNRGIYRVGGVILLFGFIAFQTLLYFETSGT